MANIDLSHTARSINPFAWIVTFIDVLRSAVQMNQFAQDAIARGESGDALHASMLRELRQYG